MRVLLALAASVMALGAGCAASVGPPAGGTSSATATITGVVLASPGCPGPQRVDSPCPDRPVAGGAVELLAGSTTVASTTTGSDGRFELHAQPGHYTVVAHNAGYRSSISQDVDVVDSTDVTLVVDSGMR